MASRWEQLLDQKPVPLLDALVDQVARLLVTELGRWPLPVVEVDPSTLGDFGELLDASRPAPGPAVYQTAFLLAQWELTRETGALDDFVRNQRYLAQGVAPTERGALLFVTRWLVEQLLSLSDATGGRVRRPELVRCLEQTRQRWAHLRAAEAES